MLENKKWESLVWIIIWILLLTFVIMWLYNLILYSENTNISFEENSVKWILKDNVQSISYKINTNGINEWSGFYIYKNNGSKTFEVFTGASNIKYKYIDMYGEFTDTWVTDKNIYERIIKVEKIDPITNGRIYSVSINNYYRK